MSKCKDCGEVPCEYCAGCNCSDSKQTCIECRPKDDGSDRDYWADKAREYQIENPRELDETN